jgi:hypothetical protein
MWEYYPQMEGTSAAAPNSALPAVIWGMPEEILLAQIVFLEYNTFKMSGKILKNYC